MALLVVLLVLIALGVIGWRLGADSRDGRDWQSYELARGNQVGSVPVCNGGISDGT
jgi:hypothetical protein